MKLWTFYDRHNGTSLNHIDRLAKEASKVTDEKALSEPAKKYMEAREAFEKALEDIGFDFE